MVDSASPKCWNGTATNINALINSGSSTLSGSGAVPTAWWGDTSYYKTRTLAINSNTTSTSQLQLNNIDLNALALTGNLTIMYAAQKIYYGLGPSSGPGNSAFFNASYSGYTEGWRITEGNQGTPGSPFTGQHSWSLGFPDVQAGLTVNDINSNVNRMNIVAFTVNPTTIAGWCNGTYITRTNPQNYISGSNNCIFAGREGGEGSFNGLLGFMMFYNRALTLTEIQQNFNAMRGRYNL